ncbi:MAG: AMP-binding protein [Acidimicrobiales bacterium]
MLPRSWHEHLPAGAAAGGGALNGAGTLTAAWGRSWPTTPDAPALLQCWPGPDQGRWVGYGELDERTRAAAARWRARGLVPGDRVVWSPSPTVSSVVANLAALRAGLTVVPVNPSYTARELRHVVTDVGPAAIVAGDASLAGALAGAGDAAGAGVACLLAAELDAGSSSGPAAADDLDSAPPDAAALVAYTSGTTGAPKGAVLRHENVLANSSALALAWRWTPEDRLVHALPLFHGHGLCAALYSTLLVGASAVLLPGFDADAVLDAAAEPGASLFFGVPTMYHRLAGSGRAPELGRLRLAVSGSAPLAADLHGELRRQGVDVLERYGMTETLLTISNPYDGERRAGTVGFPLPGVEARVEDGELLVRGPQVFAGYLDRPEATAAAFTDGWFRTGDMAEIEDDGYVRLLGRAGDVVISGGFNVYPAEVENVLMGLGGVAEVVVTGTPSEEWGEVVTAWIVPDGSAPDGAELLAQAAGQLAPYKRPRIVHFVDALPRNAMGKVMRSQLRRQGPSGRAG